MKPIYTLLWILIACYSVAFLGAQATFIGLPQWYPSIVKPAWTPPN